MIKYFLDYKVKIDDKDYNLFGLPYQKYNIILWNGAAKGEKVFTNTDLSTFNSLSLLKEENSIILHYNGSHYEILRHVSLIDKEPTVQKQLEGFNYHILEKKPTLYLSVPNLDSKPPIVLSEGFNRLLLLLLLSSTSVSSSLPTTALLGLVTLDT